MNKTLRLKVAREYLSLRDRMERKKAILKIRDKWGVALSSLKRYVAELRMN